MIKVNNLSKEFHEQGTSNELLAVDHVDFTIQNGSFCALVGESGSGKSTLAQLMCGLLVPSSGEVLFEGKNISLCRGKQKQILRSKIQLILQDGKGAMDPRFTVYQIIAEPIRNFRKLSKKEEEREINDLLTMMELPEEIKLRKAHELSGGQQKRVCIARALAAQPDVLIFDEAVSGLDVLVRKHILDLLKRLHQERKMTCFFITHDLDVALYLADRVMVMRCGKIIEDRTFHGSTDCLHIRIPSFCCILLLHIWVKPFNKYVYPAEKHDIKINKGDFVHETEKTFSFRTRTCDVPCYGSLRHEP